MDQLKSLLRLYDKYSLLYENQPSTFLTEKGRFLIISLDNLNEY
jgi:hypothetical protein